MSTRNGFAALALLLLLGSRGGLAQEAGVNRVAGAKGLTCVFQLVATGTWSSGSAHAEVKPSQLRVVFNAINTDEGTAGSVGQFGRSDIIAKLSGNILHLIESFRDGPVYMTTVFSAESRPGKLKAVHTRHEYTDVSVPGFTSSPEQYYGECEVSER
ncbi:MAG: hypothetical protein ABJA98_00545 [Acidobacteriota bacterium]